MATLSAGDVAPTFTLPAHDGTEVDLAELRGRTERGVIVYFYPKAATPGCTREACDFRDNLASLTAAGYVVVGVSADPIEDLQAFASDHHLTFPLLSDDGGQVAREWGSWGEKAFGGRTFTGVLRSTFVVDPTGTLTRAQYDVNADGHVAQLREELLG